MQIDWLIERINGSGPPLILDGGTGTELQNSGVPMDGKVWSGRAVLTHPLVVKNIHQQFIAAGAEVIIANTFATARHMLEPGGLASEIRHINQTAVKLAIDARDSAAQQPVAVAGSICEWAPNDNGMWHTAEAVYRSSLEQAEILAESGVDLIALEMCQEVELSIAAIDAALQTGLPIWIGVSAKTHQRCDSLSVSDYSELGFEELVKSLSDYPAMIMNIMHTPIIDVDKSISIIKRHWGGPIGVYPESGYFTMPDWNFVDIIEPELLAEMASNWVDNGVRLLGGCCGLGSAHIAVLRNVLT